MAGDNSDRLRAAAVQRLESLQRAGVMQLPRGVAGARWGETGAEVEADGGGSTICPAAEAASPVAASLNPVSPTPASPIVTKEIKKVPKTTGWQSQGSEQLFDVADAAAKEVSAAATLEILEQEVAACTRCDELASQRSHTVFGVGNPTARLCFMGEAPGADEDRLGEPFVGRAGQLLNKIIEACKMRREDVYILNMIKCRPPGNRNPLPQELSNCRRFLERQLELIQPEYICCLGAVAAQNLLNSTASIGRLRGVVHAFRGAKVVCTYHPAYLLRNPGAKKDTWEDMKLLMREMGVEL